jgi:translation initiation factor RLI1
MVRDVSDELTADSGLSVSLCLYLLDRPIVYADSPSRCAVSRMSREREWYVQVRSGLVYERLTDY